MIKTKITDPLRLGRKTAGNRLVMPPLVIWQSDLDGMVKENHLIHYGRCSGAGYTIVEATAVSPEGRLSDRQLGIYDDKHISGLTRLASLIKEKGSLSGIQINHAGGNSSREKTGGLVPLVPSLSAYPEGADYKELTADDIDRIIGDFVNGARRAVKAGFDVIELHGAHGYLISQFLSPKKNKREDEYGGSLGNRQRFLVSLIKAVKEAVGNEILLTIRLGVGDSPYPEGEPYLTLEEGVATAVLAEELGIDFFDISVAIGVNPTTKPQDSPYSALMHHAIAVKEAVTVPVIGVGDVKYPAQAASLVGEGLVDMVAVGKGILADPGWYESALSGKDVFPCLGCKRCLWFKAETINKCPAWNKRGDVPFGEES